MCYNDAIKISVETGYPVSLGGFPSQRNSSCSAFREEKMISVAVIEDAVVSYPFGYGLSYTQFEWELVNADEIPTTISSDTEMTFKVKVTNTDPHDDLLRYRDDVQGESDQYGLESGARRRAIVRDAAAHARRHRKISQGIGWFCENGCSRTRRISDLGDNCRFAVFLRVLR